MLKITNVEVFNLEGAIRGMRNSWGSHGKSDSRTENGVFVLGENDKNLALRLILAKGNSHSKFLRDITVNMDIISHLKFFDEMATYKVGTNFNSSSMMHTLGKNPLTVNDLSFEDIDDDLKVQSLALYYEARQRWIDSGKKKPSKEWRQMVLLTPCAFNYIRTTTLNYQVLRTIYFDRKNHRLHEWRDFCNWIETLPYSFLITGKE